MVRTVIEFVCPRGRHNRRTVYGNSSASIRCSCGCGYVYSVRFR